MPFGGQPVPFILCLDGTGSLDIVVCSEHFSMMHFQPLRGGLVAATAAFSSAMHGPTPGLMARMVATVEYFDRFNELDASYRSVEARSVAAHWFHPDSDADASATTLAGWL